MSKHPFDPVAFVFGSLFLGAGIPMLLSGSGWSLFEGRWVFPLLLIIAGAVVLASTRARLARHEDVMAESSTDSGWDDPTG